MKKILAALMIVFLAGGPALALASTQQTIFTVTVASIFELTIDQGVIDFEKMKPGEVKENMPSSGITLTSRTNSGKPWFVKVSNISPFSSGSSVIPNSNFSWSGWSDGSGRWFGSGNNGMTMTPVLAYSSGGGEENNMPAGTNNHFRFRLVVPENQEPGKYMTTCFLR